MHAHATGLPEASLLVERYCHECAFIILHLPRREHKANGGLRGQDQPVNRAWRVAIARLAVCRSRPSLRASAGATAFLKQRLPVPRIVCTGAMGTDELQGRR